MCVYFCYLVRIHLLNDLSILAMYATFDMDMLDVCEKKMVKIYS